VSTTTEPERLTAEVMYEGKPGAVVLVRIAADEDALRPWRVEAPGTTIDGWLVGREDFVRRAA
jgi:hypothetical protein